MNIPNALKIHAGVIRCVNDAIRVELAYQKLVGGKRKLGITGEVGEILVCKILGLELSRDPRMEGFDAVSPKGERVQIKTRRSESGEMPAKGSRLSRFSAHPFDYTLLGLLNWHYDVVEIWKADARRLMPMIKKHKRRNPTIREFCSVGEKVYERGKA